jgi:hypothetical protein
MISLLDHLKNINRACGVKNRNVGLSAGGAQRDIHITNIPQTENKNHCVSDRTFLNFVLLLILKARSLGSVNLGTSKNIVGIAMDTSNKMIGGIPPSLERLTGLVLILNGKQLRFTAGGKKLLKGMLAYYGFNIADVKTVAHYETIRKFAISSAAAGLIGDTSREDSALNLPALVEDFFSCDKLVDEIFSELKPAPDLKLVNPSIAKPQVTEK